jgi:restriction system protein
MSKSIAPRKPTAAWLIRAGQRGEDENSVLSRSLAIIGHGEFPDLAKLKNTEQIAVTYKGEHASKKSISARAAQLDKFANQAKIGDLVALPLKLQRGMVALGYIKGPYAFTQINGEGRHTRPVDWVAQIPRTSFEQDLLDSLGAFSTVASITRNGALERLVALAEGKPDPGPPQDGQFRTGRGTLSGDVRKAADSATENVDDTGSSSQPEDFTTRARDRIGQHIRNKFPADLLTTLVAEILRADGYTVANLGGTGPDGGQDIFAAKGQFGFEGPTIVAQIKARNQLADVKDLRELTGVMNSRQATNCLFVSWSGFTRAAEKEARDQWFRLRLWKSVDVVDALLRVYEKLPEEIQLQVPLERVWVLVDQDANP